MVSPIYSPACARGRDRYRGRDQDVIAPHPDVYEPPLEITSRLELTSTKSCVFYYHTRCPASSTLRGHNYKYKINASLTDVYDNAIIFLAKGQNICKSKSIRVLHLSVSKLGCGSRELDIDRAVVTHRMLVGFILI